MSKDWIREGYSSKIHHDQTYEQAEKTLINFWENYKKEKPETLAVELPFNFWLSKVKVGGRIDRIDSLKGQNIEIIDYKTGKNMLDEKKAKDDLQLSFYALAATEVKDNILGKKPDDLTLSLFYLDSDQKVTTTRSQEDLEKAKEKILSIVAEIEKSEFRCNGSITCKNCEYKMLCETNR